MTTTHRWSDESKRQAAHQAVEFVEDGMGVGLGHGTTAMFAIVRLADRIASGELRDIVGIPCSAQAELAARRLGVPMGTLDDHPCIDIIIDGPDEVDQDLNMIKGGGGALLREKIVAVASSRRLYIVHEGKLSPRIGSLRSVRVEVIPFGWTKAFQYIESIGGAVVLRRDEDGAPFRTEQDNYIVDCSFGVLEHPGDLAITLKKYPGIVEHGLFLHIATNLIVAGPGGIQHRQS